MEASKRATLKDVAKKAKVSVGMASRVLGNYGSYSERTRLQVLSAAKALDYRPNVVARSLRLGRTKAIGVVVSNIVSYHWTTFVRGIEAAASAQGYQVILGTTADEAKTEKDYIWALHERNVDGIVLSPSPENESMLVKLAKEEFPMVLVESDMASVNVPRINVDNRLAARRATHYLLDLGHRKIALVAGTQALPSGYDRLQGYLDALAEFNIAREESLIGYGEYRFEDAYHATRRLMSLRERPTALLVCNESMTGATLQCLKDLGIRVRDDLSLIAFDDPDWTSFFTPALTTVRTPRQEVAKLALETLLARIADPASERAAAVERIIPTELVVRESCKAV
ncbi:MAG: LacI family DNA-binding transcriptional regulator [Trueperaceae bacterium]|nr:LacI family DNA-binding transcriptional regulator [Trueperaceae bacterium]